MNENFISKEVHDADMKRIEALISASEARYGRKSDKDSEQYKRLVAQIKSDGEKFKIYTRGEIKNIHTRIEGVADAFGFALDEVRNSINRLGLIMSAIGIALVIVQLGIAYFIK